MKERQREKKESVGEVRVEKTDSDERFPFASMFFFHLYVLLFFCFAALSNNIPPAPPASILNHQPGAV